MNTAFTFPPPKENASAPTNDKNINLNPASPNARDRTISASSKSDDSTATISRKSDEEVTTNSNNVNNTINEVHLSKTTPNQDFRFPRLPIISNTINVPDDPNTRNFNTNTSLTTQYNDISQKVEPNKENIFPVIDIPSPINMPNHINLNENIQKHQNSNEQITQHVIQLPPVNSEYPTRSISNNNIMINENSQNVQFTDPKTPTERTLPIDTDNNLQVSNDTHTNASMAAAESIKKPVPEEYITNLRQKMATDWKSPSEYALHILFTKFIRHAENKLKICLQYPLDSEPPISEILGEGLDPTFDQIIESLGHIARKKPKPVIDAMMFWRKTKSEAANNSAEELKELIQQYEADLGSSSRSLSASRPLNSRSSTANILSRSNTNVSNKTLKRTVSSKSNIAKQDNMRLSELQELIEVKKHDALTSDRKSLISIYILCRVLIEIVRQTPNNTDEDINDKLEEIVFTQLKVTDPISISASVIKSSNWNSFAELLGCMSERNFLSVSDRFISELEKIPKNMSPQVESNFHLLILGMRYLDLKNYPLENFEESADFIKSIAKFFSKSDNLMIRLAYAEVTNQLLLPLTGALSAEVNHPTWVEATEMLLNSANKLSSNAKYWSNGFKLTVTILCVSPPQLFTEKWVNLLVSNISKIKTKNLNERIIFAIGVSRLVWVYLYRSSETLNNTIRTLTRLLQLYLNPKKKENWLSTDLDLINPLSDGLVSIGYMFPEFLMENAMLPLLKQSFNGVNLDIDHYDKLILVINTYRRFLMCSEKPSFPENDVRTYEMDLNKISIQQSDPLYSNHEEICLYIHKLLILLDSSIGSEVWSPENEHQKQPSTPFGSFPFSFSSDNDNTAHKNNLNLILFSTVIETIPCCLSVSSRIPYKSTIEILTRNAVHGSSLIARSSHNALKSLAAKKKPYTFITWFAKYSFDFDEKTQSSYNMAYLSSKEYNTLLLLYVELLESWLEEFQSSKTEESKRGLGLDGIQLMPIGNEKEEVSEQEKLEWKNIVTVIEEVEGNGLFFLCSHDVNVRKLAIRILQIISKFDKAMVEKTVNITSGHSRTSSFHFAADQGNRLIDFLNGIDVLSLINPHKTPLSTAEKNRLLKINSKYKKGLMVKIAESSFGIDAALWQRAFPKLLIFIFQSSPVTMALCRSIVCIRLVQVHQVILRVANDPEYKPANILPETIVNQWKLYLIAACTSLTSTADQKLHIPANTIQHGRKKSQQIFTVQHQKIKSVKAIFKMVLPLLDARYPIVREAIIAGLSSMNINIYKTYVESVETFLVDWKDNSTNSQTRIEMFHILAILSRFLKEPAIINDGWIVKKISTFIKSTKRFLEDESVQNSYDYQPLRSYFAELLSRYYSNIKEHPLVDELFPFQARTSCFNYLKEWCGYSESAIIAEERYSFMIDHTENIRDKTSVSAGIEFQKNRLVITALEAMVVLCSEPITKEIQSESDIPIVISFEIRDLLFWIESLFNSNEEVVRKFGLRALENLLEKNTNNVQLFKDVAVQCISPHSHTYISVYYYITLCKSVLKLDDLILEEDELVSLGLYGLVSDKEDTRTYAVDLLSAVETKLHNSSYTKVFKERLANSSKSVYKSTAIEISSIFVDLLSQDLCLRIFASLVRILDLFPFEIKRDLLILMVPWVNKFTLKATDDLDTYMVLNNLFYVTIDLNHRLPKEVEQLWISLGKGNSFQNIHICLDFIIETSIHHRNPNFVQKARDVVLYLAHIPGGIGLMDTLLNNLEPKSMIPDSKHEILEPTNTDGKFSFIANIWERLNYSGKAILFSKAQLSIIFLVNLLTDINEFIKAKIPNLLHISICLLDHYVPIIQESASRIVGNLIFGLSPTHVKSEETVNLLRNRQLLWPYDNLVKDKKGGRSPKTMDLLIRNIISIFSDQETLQNDWQRIALRWATICPVRHVACRSFQVFRSLLTFLDQEMLRDMLHRLSNTISDENPDIQGFAMQILMTLNAIMAELDATDLITFPQLFWSLVACMNSVHEQEFIEVLSCITKFISKIDLDSPDTVQCLVATFPSNWEGHFDGLQHIAMVGLRSSNSLDITLKFLNKLNLLKDSRIIADSESRLLFALISNLPKLLHSMNQNDFTTIQVTTDSLIMLADSNNQPSLSRLIDSLAKNKFRSKKDFLSQITSFISRNYFPKYSAQTLVFFLGLLLNKLDWIKFETLEILRYVFPLVDLARPEFTGVGADLISPILRLLLTDYETDALEVLDYIPDVSGSKMDKDVLRISMGNKDIKNSNTTTTTLFGLPEESGWSIPMPTITAATTRHNVHTVFMSCANTANTEGNNQENNNVEDNVVQFHQDVDYGLNRTETVDSFATPEEKDASLSHMWAELDNLDSFFTKESNASMISPASVSNNPHERNDSIGTTNTQTLGFESAPQLYDNKVSVILNKSLARAPSNVSFKKYLADSFASTLGGDRNPSEPIYAKNRVISTPLFNNNDYINQTTTSPLNLSDSPLYSNENRKSVKSFNRQGKSQKHYHLPRF